MIINSNQIDFNDNFNKDDAVLPDVLQNHNSI